MTKDHLYQQQHNSPEMLTSAPNPIDAGSGNARGVLRTIDLQELVKRVSLERPEDQRFALFLGAGCSVTSGIPAAGELVTTKWLPRLCNVRAPGERDPEAWAARALKALGYDPDDPAASYGLVMEELFESDGDKQQEIEALCSGKLPSFAYGVLAQLVAGWQGRFNVVLTTNFDDLVEDALFYCRGVRPTVITHESLALFIRPTRTRPLVVKLHGDHRLAPKNTNLETAEIQADVRQSVAGLLHDRGLIFVGYGGHDHGIVRMLRELPPEALPFGVYWVARREPRSEIAKWLRERNAIWVRCESFDRLMLEVMLEFRPPPPDRYRFEAVMEGYFDQLRYEKVRAEIASGDEGERGRRLEEIVRQSAKELPGVSSLLSEAREAQEAQSPGSDVQAGIHEAELRYGEAVKRFPSSIQALTSYAWFLCDVRGEVDRAATFLRRAVTLAGPRNPEPLLWWDKARAYFEYGVFLSEVRGAKRKALDYIRRAYEVDPACYFFNGAAHVYWYARLRQELEPSQPDAHLPSVAERVCEEALAEASRLGNRDGEAAILSLWAMFSHWRRRKSLSPGVGGLGGSGNEDRFLEALQYSPGNAVVLARFAAYLWEAMGDSDGVEQRKRAERFFERALWANPADSYNLSNYARFLCATGRSVEGMEKARLALKLVGRYARTPDRLDLELCRYLHGDDKDRDEALAQIRRLVSPSVQGVTCTQSEFKRNFDLAKEKQHPGRKWFNALEMAIKGPSEREAWEQGLSQLDGWEAWKSSGEFGLQPGPGAPARKGSAAELVGSDVRTPSGLVGRSEPEKRRAKKRVVFRALNEKRRAKKH
jgi:Tfp pilus assembly protein PilF